MLRIQIIALAFNVLGLLVAAAVLIKRRVHIQRCNEYVRRDSAGNLYVIDPKSGAMHRLVFVNGVPQLAPKLRELSPRQKRRLKKTITRADRTIERAVREVASA